MQKPKPLQPTLTKHQLLHWINTTLNISQTKIQSLGNGITYCLLINHFYPNSIPRNKIVVMVRNTMDHKLNLRKFQEAMAGNNVRNIAFDIFRVSEMSLVDNWQLVSKLYKHFQELSKPEKQPRQVLAPIHQSQFPLPPNFHQPTNFPRPTQSLGLLTPMKGLKYFDENAKLRLESIKTMEEIKFIVKSENQTDRVKVRNLKKMLGLADEKGNYQEELEMRELFGGCNHQQVLVVID